jgi:hypothetical protein
MLSLNNPVREMTFSITQNEEPLIQFRGQVGLFPRSPHLAVLSVLDEELTKPESWRKTTGFRQVAVTAQ